LYPPSAILRAAGVDPAAVCTACGLDDPDRTLVRPAPKWLARAWRGPVGAMTVPWAIYVRPDLLEGDKAVLARLLQHELVHVRQWSEHGAIGFLSRYLRAYISNRRKGLCHLDAYKAIPLEEEARRIAGY
jgi:hypothetical protein